MLQEQLQQGESIAKFFAPSLHTLTDPKAFDDFKNESNWQERLSLVKDNPEPICQIRYAWLLHYQGDAQACLEGLESFKNHPLGYVLYMEALSVLGQNEKLLKMLGSWKPFAQEHVEATILGYEVTASVYFLVHEDYQSALRFFYRAEALAMHYELTRRLQVIHTNLEYVANTFDLDITLEQIISPDVSSSGVVQINRFQSHLRVSNIEGIRNDSHISAANTHLAQATLVYKDWFLKPEAIVNAARLVSDNVPCLPEFQVYWALLMLQVYAKRGALNGLASPNRIMSILDKAVGRMSQSEILGMQKFVARYYPLGCAIASQLDSRLELLKPEVGIVWADLPRDGIRFGSEKPITIASRVREALLEDGLNATNHHTRAVFRLHGEYRRRLKHVLSQNDLKLTDTTTISAVYRGLDMLSSDLGERSLHEKAQEALANSSYLQQLVSL